MPSASTEWAYANNARIALFFLALALLLIGMGLLAVVAWGQDAALAGGALLTIAVFLLVFSVLVFLPRLARRGAVSFSVYSRRSIADAERAITAAIEESGRTAQVRRVRTRGRSPPVIVTADGIPARFRIEVSRHAAGPETGEWTEIIESVPLFGEGEAEALRVKVLERLHGATAAKE